MIVAAPVASPVFDHLDRLTDGRGLFEHALLAEPRRDHGYCVDDVARALVVTCREPRPSTRVDRLAHRYLAFVVDAVEPDGTCHNRMDVEGVWRDSSGTGDWWGRAVWGLGVAAATGTTAGMRARALSCFRVAVRQRSPDLRATAFSALGAGVVLQRWPEEPAARDLLRDAVTTLLLPDQGFWPWPEARLSYANAVLPDALMVAGDAIGDPRALARGLGLLTFLLDHERAEGHLSVTPVGGRGPEDSGPGFDQQPIEVAAIADACATAFQVTGRSTWLEGLTTCWDWFRGDNDSGVALFDPETGGGFDGLERDGVNANQGAESTLAFLSTAQHARQFRELI